MFGFFKVNNKGGYKGYEINSYNNSECYYSFFSGIFFFF